MAELKQRTTDETVRELGVSGLAQVFRTDVKATRVSQFRAEEESKSGAIFRLKRKAKTRSDQ